MLWDDKMENAVALIKGTLPDRFQRIGQLRADEADAVSEGIWTNIFQAFWKDNTIQIDAPFEGIFPDAYAAGRQNEICK